MVSTGDGSPGINISDDVSVFDSLNMMAIMWTLSIVLVATAIFYQLFKCVKHRLCMSDDDYIREYFTELELAERIDLTPVFAGDKTPPRFNTRGSFMTSSLINPLSSHQSST